VPCELRSAVDWESYTYLSIQPYFRLSAKLVSAYRTIDS